MGALRLVIVLVIAALAAVGLALAVRHMTARAPVQAVAATPPPQPLVRVLVAKRDLNPGDRLQAQDVAWQSWPAGTVNPAFVTGGPVDPKANLADKAQAALQAAVAGDPALQPVAGALVREPILTNEPVSRRKLVKNGQAGFMAVRLPAGAVAMSLPVTVDTAVGGFILPGDHVDVIENMKMTGGGSTGGPVQLVQSHVVMRNLTVLAIDQTTELKQGASSVVGASATLQVPADDAATLSQAKEQASPLILVLRSYEDMAGPQGHAGPAAPTPGAAVRVRARPSQDMQVRVFRAGQLSEVLTP